MNACIKLIAATTTTVVAISSAAFGAPINTSDFGVYTNVVAQRDFPAPPGREESTFDGGEAASNIDSVSGTYNLTNGFSGTGTATASARSNLATGSVGISGSCPDASQCASATARWKDTVTFDLSHLTNTDFVDIGFALALEGSMEKNAQIGTNFFIQDSFSNLVQIGTAYRDNTTTNPIGTVYEIGEVPNFVISSQVGNFSTFTQELMDGTFSLQGGQIIDLVINLTLTGGGDFDVFNTASFRLITDELFTSASGVFLTDVQPVPIPAALPLLLSALGALGFIGWRRKRLPANQTS